VNPKLLRKVEPFPTNTLVPYSPAYLSGWLVEHYQIDLTEATAKSRERMDSDLRELCAREIPGDTYTNLVVTPTCTEQTFKHILAPIWLVTYTYGKST
jgi:hypothetical protein